jgi:ATP-dependent Clp protease protease subunit
MLMRGKRTAKEEKEEEEGLSEKGILFLSGEINEASAGTLEREIINQNLKGGLPFLQMLISSPGGDVLSGFGLIDVMGWSKIPIATTGIGRVASMALLVLMAGKRGDRVATANSLLLSHRFWGLSLGNYSDMLAKRKMEDILHATVVKHYIAHSHLRDAHEVEKQLLRDVDVWMTPEEARDFGIIDRIESQN